LGHVVDMKWETRQFKKRARRNQLEGGQGKKGEGGGGTSNSVRKNMKSRMEKSHENWRKK